jgi:ADP-ribose pyrophosphatase
MQRHPLVEVLRSDTLLRGRIFDVVDESIRLPSGLRQDVLVVDHPGAVCVAPLLPSGELLLVRQYRHAAGDWLVELPAGRLEPEESRRAAAERELEEETGHRAGRVELLRSSSPPRLLLGAHEPVSRATSSPCRRASGGRR